MSADEVALHRAPKWLIPLIWVGFGAIAVWSAADVLASIILVVPLCVLFASGLTWYFRRIGVFVGQDHIRVAGLVDRTVEIRAVKEVVGVRRIGPILIVTDDFNIPYHNGPAYWSRNRERLVMYLRWVCWEGSRDGMVDLPELEERVARGYTDDER